MLEAEHRLHVLDAHADVLGQAVVGRDETGEHRVATGLGDDPTDQDGAQWRSLSKGHVGVPQLDLRTLFAVVFEDGDLRKTVDGRIGGMGLQVTEPAR